jgi:hypothetical protein
MVDRDAKEPIEDINKYFPHDLLTRSPKTLTKYDLVNRFYNSKC